MSRQNDALEGLLEVCEQIRNLQEKVGREPGENLEAPTRQARARVGMLRQEVFSALPSLSSQPAAQALSDAELLLLGFLFHHRISGRPSPPSGADLCALLARAGHPAGSSLSLLAAGAPLRQGGWLLSTTPAQGFDPLDNLFAASPSALSLFWQEGLAAPREEKPEAPLEPYSSEEECFWDYFAWRNICIHRAQLLFDPLYPNVEFPGRHRALWQKARSARLRIRSRLARTPGGADFSLETFQHRYRLGADEMLVALHLLFCEVVDGEPFLSALECLRVIAETRSGLFRKRGVVGPSGRLRKEGLVLGESAEVAKTLAAEICLADWAVEEMTSGLGRLPRLDSRIFDDLLRGEEE
ncbi:MAG: hypothetical protein ACE5H3_04710 [Planctomycetota bacterium]